MARRPAKIPTPPPVAMYRVLRPLEDGQGGIHQPGTILTAAQIRRESLLPLLECGALMFHLDPTAIAALPDH